MKNNIKHSIELFNAIEKGLEKSRELSLPPAFAYDRVSTAEQADGLSLEYQSQGAAKYAKEHDLHIAHYFTIAESASKEGRRVFNEMIDMALRFEVKHLIFKSTDRMSRNYRDLARIIDLIERHDFAIHFYQTNKVITRESSHDEKFIIGIEQAVAKHLSDKISHDIRNVNKYKVQKGIYCGQAPYGYKYDRQQKRFIIDKNTEYILRFIFDEFDTGRYSIETLRELLNKKRIAAAKGGEWSKSSVYQTLKNPFYHGEFIHDGTLLKGNHETYYDRDRFDERMKRMKLSCVSSRHRNHTALLQKLMMCECGKVMTPDLKKRKYLYYVHKCSHKNMRQSTIAENVLFARIDKKINGIRFYTESADMMRALFGNTIINHKKERNSEIMGQRRRLSGLELKKNRLYDLYTEDENFSREDLKRKLFEIDRSIVSLKSYLSSLEQDQKQATLDVEDVIITFLGLRDVYKTSKSEKKVRILKEMAERVVVNKDALAINWKKPFSYFIQ